jgi:hypothetical protein
MQDDKNHRKRAQAQSRVAREPISLDKRLAYSPTEFAALCGRSATWGYRQSGALEYSCTFDSFWLDKVLGGRAEQKLIIERMQRLSPASQRNNLL